MERRESKQRGIKPSSVYTRHDRSDFPGLDFAPIRELLDELVLPPIDEGATLLEDRRALTLVKIADRLLRGFLPRSKATIFGYES
jgi:hypothetical protein